MKIYFETKAPTQQGVRFSESKPKVDDNSLAFLFIHFFGIII